MESIKDCIGTTKLKDLRKLMLDNGYNAYIIPHGDQHDNEYLANVDERVAFISNFTGSNAICLVTQDIALCWTDGRYYIQAEKELYPGWQMKKMGRGEETLSAYIKANITLNVTIGLDYSLVSNDCFCSGFMS